MLAMDLCLCIGTLQTEFHRDFIPLQKGPKTGRSEVLWEWWGWRRLEMAASIWVFIQ